MKRGIHCPCMVSSVQEASLQQTWADPGFLLGIGFKRLGVQGV